MESVVSKYMLAHPSVFAVADKYMIFIPFSEEVTLKVRVGDKIYCDECNGVMRSRSNMHKVTVPMSALDEEGGYTVIYRRFLERRPYYPISEDEVELGYDFYPVPKDGRINIYHISDAHNLVAEPVRAGSYFGDALHLLVLNGDIPNHSGDIKNFNAICDIAGQITKGRIPAVFARGNHDTRGIYAEDMPNYIPIHNGKTYYTFRVGAIWGMVLDCGEDKRDECAEYGSTVCFHEFRMQETQFIKEVIANAENEYLAEGVEYKLVISHIPFTHIQPPPFDIEQELYGEWSRLMRDCVRPDLLLYGHMHLCEIWEAGGKNDSLGQACVAIVGSKPIMGKGEDAGFIGCALTLDGDSAEVVFNDDKGKAIRNTVKLV